MDLSYRAGPICPARNCKVIQRCTMGLLSLIEPNSGSNLAYDRLDLCALIFFFHEETADGGVGGCLPRGELQYIHKGTGIAFRWR